MLKRLKGAYSYFRSVSGGIDPFKNGRNIRAYIRPWEGNGASAIMHEIFIPSDEAGVEHELWHVFQYNFYGLVSRTSDKYWVYEASAEHMGARAYKNYTAAYNINDYMKTHYLDALRDGVTSIDNFHDFPYGQSVKYYPTVGFFTFLANSQTGLGGDKVMTGVLNSPHLDKFHEYALHSYTDERFDVYPHGTTGSSEKFGTFVPGTIKYTSVNTLKTPGSQVFNLKNNSAKYYRLKTDNENLKKYKLKVRVQNASVKSECRDKLKVKALVCSEKMTPVKDCSEKTVPLTDNWNSALELKDFSHIDIISSGTNGSLLPGCNRPGGDTGIINGVLEYGYECPTFTLPSGSVTSSTKNSCLIKSISKGSVVREPGLAELNGFHHFNVNPNGGIYFDVVYYGGYYQALTVPGVSFSSGQINKLGMSTSFSKSDIPVGWGQATSISPHKADLSGNIETFADGTVMKTINGFKTRPVNPCSNPNGCGVSFNPLKVKASATVETIKVNFTSTGFTVTPSNPDKSWTVKLDGDTNADSAPDITKQYSDSGTISFPLKGVEPDGVYTATVYYDECNDNNYKAKASGLITSCTP